jgi:hypothetical protein
MSDCETYETSISALADGELPREDLLPTLDHLAECASCQAFYRDVRALAAALPSDPEAIWRRIEAAAAPALTRTGQSRPWAMRLAAAVLLVASLGGAIALGRSAQRPTEEPIEITLGEDRGRMTEQRFLDLTVELLRSDSRYHQEMLQVLTAVIDRRTRPETPTDFNAPLPEGNDGGSDNWRPAQGARRLS